MNAVPPGPNGPNFPTGPNSDGLRGGLEDWSHIT